MVSVSHLRWSPSFPAPVFAGCARLIFWHIDRWSWIDLPTGLLPYDGYVQNDSKTCFSNTGHRNTVPTITST
eukprot:1395879-Amphidinium_carterae.1